MRLHITDSRGQVWLHQFGSMFSDGWGRTLRHIEDIRCMRYAHA
jgi:hypothetical protein